MEKRTKYILGAVGILLVWHLLLRKDKENIEIGQIEPDFSSMYPNYVEEPLENVKRTILPIKPDIYAGTGGYKPPTILGGTDAFKIIDPNTNLKYVKLSQDKILSSFENYNQGDTILQGATIKYTR